MSNGQLKSFGERQLQKSGFHFDIPAGTWPQTGRDNKPEGSQSVELLRRVLF